MKRILPLILAALIFLSGCNLSAERMKEPVTFYYVRSGFATDMSQVIGTEQREASGHRGDLSYLLALYLIGPSQEGLATPLPKGTRIITVEDRAGGIQLKLSDTEEAMTDAEFSLACACLSLTSMDLTGAERVTILSGNRTVTMTRENLELYDSGSTAAAMEETK